MQKSQNLTKTICEIGIFSAIGFILDEFQSIFFKGVFINGGSIGFAMIVVLIIGYRIGFLAALLTGLLMGLFDLATGAFIIHPAQLILDYLISYALVALGVLFRPIFYKNQKHQILILMIATIVGGIAKLLSHYLSGVIFWGDPNYFAWGLTTLSPYLYCFIYNFAFIGPSILITCLFLFFMYKRGKNILITTDNSNNEVVEMKSNKELAASITTTTLGFITFTYFLTDYIKSFQITLDNSSIEYAFAKDSMVIFILGLFIMIGGIICLINNIKKISKIKLHICTYIFASSISLIYSTTELVKHAQKNTPYIPYLIWLFVSVIILILSIIILYKFSKKRT